MEEASMYFTIFENIQVEIYSHQSNFMIKWRIFLPEMKKSKKKLEKNQFENLVNLMIRRMFIISKGFELSHKNYFNLRTSHINITVEQIRSLNK